MRCQQICWKRVVADWRCAVDVVFGESFGLALTAGGSVFSFGANDFGQLGVGHLRSSSQVRVLAVSLSGWFADASALLLQPVAISTFGNVKERVVQIAAGLQHSVALTGTVLDVCCCRLIGSCLFAASGSVYCWGRGEEGQSGTLNKIQVNRRHAGFLVVGARLNDFALSCLWQLVPRYVSKLQKENVVKICCGNRWVCALTGESQFACSVPVLHASDRCLPVVAPVG